jgi:hypothetical protein
MAGSSDKSPTPAATDVETELIALRADVAGLGDSVRRMVLEAPEMARDSVEGWISREPLRATLYAAGFGFVMSLVIAR